MILSERSSGTNTGAAPFPRYAFNPHSEHGLKHLWNQDRLHRPGRLDATTLQNS